MNAELRAWLVDLLSSPLFTQIAPFLVLFVFPALVFLAASRAHPKTLFYQTLMGLESLAVIAPWRWLSNASSKSPPANHHHHHHHKHLTKKHPRSRSEQRAAPPPDSERYYPGLALASLSYLQLHIDTIYEKAEILDVPTPVIDSLRQLLQRLNVPRSSYHAIRPVEIIDTLSNVQGRTNALFYSREHQDAQELFQLLSECVKNEITAVDKEGKRDRGLGGLSQNPESTKEIGKSVFDGLTANRRSCVTCEYTEAVMHFSLDNLQLSLPRYTGACRLEDCLEDYTRLEILRDCVCRKCSLVATHRRLKDELATLQDALKPENNPSASKQRRFKDIKRFEARVHSSLEQGRIEDELKHVRLERVVSPAAKQTMIARPPPVLALHINRSIHYGGQYATKNSTRLIFPEILDITPYTTSGNLSTKPTSSISSPPPPSTYNSLPRRSSTPTPSTHTSHLPTLYRLAAVVCHYGQHSFGHYICYRRKPRVSSLSKEKRWAPPKLVDPLLVHELVDKESHGSWANGNAHSHSPRSSTDRGHSSSAPDSDGDQSFDHPRFLWEGEDPPEAGRGWLRISDDAVRECGIEAVLAEGSGAFMLYYERVVMDRMGIYPSRVPSRMAANGEELQEGERHKSKETSSNEVDRETIHASTEPYAQEYTAYAEYASQGGAIGAFGTSGTESEETLKPRTKTVVMNGSVDTLVSEVGVGVASSSSSSSSLMDNRSAAATSEQQPLTTNMAGIGAGLGKPRIIRSVEAGRMASSGLARSGTSATATPRLASESPPPAASGQIDRKADSAPSSPTTAKSKSKKTHQSAGGVENHQDHHHHHRQTNGDEVYPSTSSPLHHHSNSHSKHQSWSSSPSSSKPSPLILQLQQHSQSLQSPSPLSPLGSPPKPRPNTLKRKPRYPGSPNKPAAASSSTPPQGPQAAAPAPVVAGTFGP
ncbi:hypothetical protein M378DRAFT_7310 [Amanita muscaria Koide BX008]|uniref:ubiquitinyl hydrolase 1 n=1 Tax=Amanita muscaria (strain Koide BX008) TaxID=946122 RepID=A0A0C2TT59_AMAMK|nr:hypothetical protein M378DRAFT_7310 [Amanita muscaria Koide BX008]